MSKVHLFRLDGHSPVPCTLNEWGVAMQLESNKVKSEMVGHTHILTFFLGLDHNPGQHGTPQLFETISYDKSGQCTHCIRSATWEEAKATHMTVIQIVKAGQDIYTATQQHKRGNQDVPRS
jgi:hypothetical protein